MSGANGNGSVRHVLVAGDRALCGSTAGEIPGAPYCDECLERAAELVRCGQAGGGQHGDVNFDISPRTWTIGYRCSGCGRTGEAAVTAKSPIYIGGILARTECPGCGATGTLKED
jgi:hypothetical protein